MLKEIILLALGSLWSNKFRTFLTILSVTIGAFSIVVMMSLAESGSRTLARSVEEVGGARLVWWVPEDVPDPLDRSRYARGITPSDVYAIRSLPFIALATGMSTLRQKTIYFQPDNAPKVDIVAMQQGLLEGFTWPMASGRDINPADEADYARVCVLTDGVARILFQNPEKAVGQRITVLGKPYHVVGVLKKRKMLMRMSLGFDWDNSVFVPLATAEKRDGLDTRGMVVVAFVESPEHSKTVISLGNSVMLARHNGVRDFRSINFGEVVSQFNQFFNITTLIVGIIAAISLVAGGIGVMNIMLVSVTERVREIGIRKAVGASVMVVLLQFLGEAIVLSTLGGLVGVVGGLLVTFLVHMGLARWSEFWVSHYSTVGVALSLTVTSCIGLFFGAIPAWRAARLDIVEALRR